MENFCDTKKRILERDFLHFGTFWHVGNLFYQCMMENVPIGFTIMFLMCLCNLVLEQKNKL